MHKILGYAKTENASTYEAPGYRVSGHSVWKQTGLSQRVPNAVQ